MITLTGILSERITNAAVTGGTCVSIRAGSNRVFIGMDIMGRYAAQDVSITTDQARRMAKFLTGIADEVDAEIARDAAADLEAS